MSSPRHRHLIATASDARCGDFLIEHWYPSLVENVILAGVDILVLDYGLTPVQRAKVAGEGMILRDGRRKGHITNVRHFDLADFLAEDDHDQVLLVDSGDLIFQSDISRLFEENRRMVRAVCDERTFPLQEVLPILQDLRPQVRDTVARAVAGRPQINGGFLLAPAATFRKIATEFAGLTASLTTFATDQMVVNYLLRRDGFHELPSRYNFVLVAARSRFTIRDGRFHDAAGELIPVVHNAGYHQFFRRVADFGYGPARNRCKWISPLAVRGLFAASGLLAATLRPLQKLRTGGAACEG